MSEWEAQTSRLREAADAMMEAAVRCFNWPGLAEEKVATAALLRAVADERESFAERVGPAVMEDYDDATFDAALALADAILGAES